VFVSFIVFYHLFIILYCNVIFYATSNKPLFLNVNDDIADGEENATFGAWLKKARFSSSYQSITHSSPELQFLFL